MPFAYIPRYVKQFLAHNATGLGVLDQVLDFGQNDSSGYGKPLRISAQDGENSQ